MAKRAQAKQLFTASDVGKFCQVDLKTIHNWADRGEIRYFRTPGRHLRFRRVDVLEFLRKYGYPVPDVLRQGGPKVHVIDQDGSAARGLDKLLDDGVDVSGFSDPVDALIAMGGQAPDVAVIEPADGELGGLALIEKLRGGDETRHVRIVVYTRQADIREQALAAGASAFVLKPDLGRLGEAIGALLDD
ncbi:MAG: helix-turn-helix domain-containing protein [Myxococcales bacterium]|nr:helix-turn-helix domain-containing protein [Myxococcales bacterium]